MGWNLDKEQRRGRRVGMVTPVKFAVLSADGTASDWVQSLTTNVSRDGLSFVTPMSIPIHTRLRLEVSLPGQSEDLSAEGIAVRVVGELPDEGFEYGVAFDESTPAEGLERLVRAVDVVPLLEMMLKEGAEALHLVVGTPPLLRVGGYLQEMDTKPFVAEAVARLILGTLGARQRRSLVLRRELDYPLAIPGLGRWRVNAHFQKGNLEAVFHQVEPAPPTLEEMGLPESVRDLVLGDRGLVLVTCCSERVRSMTLAAMVDTINGSTKKVVVCVEDPVYFVHQNRNCIVKQREIPNDAVSLQEGLKQAIRQDADIITVGNVRDVDSMDALLHAAENGRLVLAGMSTMNVTETVNRIAAMYPAEQRHSVLNMLSVALRGIVNQRVLVSAEGQQISAVEVVAMNEGIRQAIRFDKLDQVGNLMHQVPGAIALEVSLRNLVLGGRVDLESASAVANDPEHLQRMVTEQRG
jgi:twitching motility protein PilT